MTIADRCDDGYREEECVWEVPERILIIIYCCVFFAQPVFRPAFNLAIIVEVACCLKMEKGKEFEPPRAPSRIPLNKTLSSWELDAPQRW